MFRVLGIDPGSENLGFAVIDIDVETDTMDLRLLTAGGLNTDYLFNHKSDPYLHLGERLAKFTLIKQFYVELFNEYQPDFVIAEDCYLRRGFRGVPLVTAYRSLVEGLLIIRQALSEYNDTYHLALVDPPTAKKSVGAPAKGGDKEEIRKALTKLKDLKGLERLSEYNEHTCDAIAISYHAAKLLQQEYLGLVQVGAYDDFVKPVNPKRQRKRRQSVSH